jgi:hypothetical protein
VALYSVLLVLLFLAGSAVGGRQIVSLVKQSNQRFRESGRFRVWILIAVFLPVVVLLFFTPHIYGDDKTYITMVNDILSTNRLYLTNVNTGGEDGWLLAKYALSSYWTWVAYIAKITGIHPLILCKTVLGLIFVPTSYAIQGLFADFLFYGDRRKTNIFLLLVVLVSLFGGFSGYTVTFRLYTWVWQSKAFLAIIVLPFLLYYCNLIYSAKPGFREYLLLFIMNIATCSTTLTGTGLAVAMVCVTAAMYSVIRKQIGILGKTLLSCVPALVLMLIYIRFDYILEKINFY